MKEMARLAQAGLNEGYQTEIHDDFLIVVHVPTLGWLINSPKEYPMWSCKPNIFKTKFGDGFKYTQSWKKLKFYKSVFEAFYWYMLEKHFKLDLIITRIKSGRVNIFWCVLSLFLMGSFMYYNLIQ